MKALIAAAAVGLLLVGAEQLPGQATDSTTLRPTDVVVMIYRDTHYDGIYRASGISRVCGKLDYMLPHRSNSFVVEFPDDDVNLGVRLLTFDADTLSAGSITPSFHLTVAVRTPSGGTPPAFVVRAKEPRYGEPGTAERFKAAGRDSLAVVGVATKGTKVDVKVTVVCHPKP